VGVTPFLTLAFLARPPWPRRSSSPTVVAAVAPAGLSVAHRRGRIGRRLLRASARGSGERGPLL